ncbi:acetate--CoA ligase family protein [Candidatus Woesebacteria bacterium]|nr:acetate--CoA ligase family protein [Candidatus Woesebacteria bacterium]
MHFNTLFNPASIAVVGASTREGSVSNDVIRNLHKQGYKGHIYPINPKGEPILGLTTFTSLQEIGKPVDLAVIIIPAKGVPNVMREIVNIGTKAVVVISAGFKEAGHEGALLEEEIAKIANENDITLVGPNCLGIINPHHNLNISFAKAAALPGNVAFISQSGALCSSVLDYAEEYGIGFSKFASVGNKACLDEVDLLEGLAEDPDTKVILMYIEGLADAQRFISRVRKVTLSDNPKPIIALKAGRTSDGASASASHTGALAGNDEAFNALFKQAGVIRVSTVEDLFIYAAAFAHNEKLEGNQIAVVSNAGGPGVLVTDELVMRGLKIARFAPETTELLKNSLPVAANIHNPVDVLGDAKSDRYKMALEAIINDPNVDGVIVVLTPQSMTDVNEVAIVLGNIKIMTKKPIVASFMGSQSTREGEGILLRHNVANILFPESAARAMTELYHFYNHQKDTKDLPQSPLEDVDKTFVSNLLTRLKAAGQTHIPEAIALQILDAYKLPLQKHTIVRSRQELENQRQTITYPVAMKIVSKDIVHKTDVGGIILDVVSENMLASYDHMMQTVAQRAPTAQLEGVLLVEMAPKNGFEFVVGVNKDPSLGHLVMFGLGGVFVEILKDVAFRLAPVTAHDVHEMLQEIKSSKLLAGVRGMPALDTGSIVDCVLRISQLVQDFPQIKELDINPLLVLPKGRGVRVLDARIIIS